MAEMTLLVDAGGTKTDWALVEDGSVFRFRTDGINPAVMGRERILAAVLSASDRMGGKSAGVTSIRYYGAGVVGTEHLLGLDAVLKNVFPKASVAYGTDLLAAAEAGLVGCEVAAGRHAAEVESRLCGEPFDVPLVEHADILVQK